MENKILGCFAAIICIFLFIACQDSNESENTNAVFTPVGFEKVSNGSMVQFSARSFMMGSLNKEGGANSSSPQHSVSLDTFAIDVWEVTVADYRTCVEAKKCSEPKRSKPNSDEPKSDEPKSDETSNWDEKGREDHPVNWVTSNQAEKYCAFVGKRLPTEAEWEMAASWNNGEKYETPVGKAAVGCDNAIVSYGSVKGCGRDGTWPVGSKPSEINGTYDMAGNVREWLSTDSVDYTALDKKNPQGSSSGVIRGIRGGSFKITPITATLRTFLAPTVPESDIGFRCAKSHSPASTIEPLSDSTDDMVLIPEGKFIRGSGSAVLNLLPKNLNERFEHLVELTRAYYIDRLEVTNRDYKQCAEKGVCADSHSLVPKSKDEHPVEAVSWFEAKKYCEHVGKRLPTEAEWEKAATMKAGVKYSSNMKKAKYPNGLDEITCDEAVMRSLLSGMLCKDASWGGVFGTQEVGKKKTEQGGTKDMAGNVAEWVNDRYEDVIWPDNLKLAEQDPTGPSVGAKRVYRGGSYAEGASDQTGTRRRGLSPESAVDGIGFRCAKFKNP